MSYEVTPEQFGVCGRTEDQATATANSRAIQAAIDSFGPSGSGIVKALGGYPINEPIVLTTGVKLKFGGWGRSNITSHPSSYLKWLGPAGLPMALVDDYFGASIEDVRFIGNSASKPACAIELRDDGVHNVSFTTLRRI